MDKWLERGTDTNIILTVQLAGRSCETLQYTLPAATPKHGSTQIPTQTGVTSMWTSGSQGEGGGQQAV